MFKARVGKLLENCRWVIVVVIFTSISACAAQTPNHPVSKVVKVADLAPAFEQANLLPLDSTLVVLDIDDTLLTATEFFGSDKWYDWQRGRALSPNGQALVTSDSDKVSCLFDTLGMTYEIATNKPTQENMLELVEQAQQDILILTARSGNYRPATMRELARSGLDFSEKALTPENIGYHYDMTHGGRTATLSYVDGVFMVQGMDKGVMLLDLLQRVNKKYQAVVFVDDKTHNINNMANALKAAGIDYYGFHYTKVDKTVSLEEVKHAQAAAKDLTSMLKKHFVDRAQSIETGQCDY
jgi:FMN phosphatase YigB (HAD superfamily)